MRGSANALRVHGSAADIAETARRAPTSLSARPRATTPPRMPPMTPSPPSALARSNRENMVPDIDDMLSPKLPRVDFSAGTPVEPSPAPPAPKVTTDEVVRVLSWRSSASMPVFFCGNVLFLGAASWSATGLLSFLAKVLVVQIAWGFTQRHVFGRPAPPMTLTADDIAEYARRLEASANGALRLYERVCLAADLRIAVLTVMSVYAFTLASSFVSVGTMAYTGFLAAFGAAPAYGLVQTHVEQACAMAARECERVIAALTFKHVLGMTAGAFFAWLGAGLWTKFVVMLTVPMVLKLYRDANRDEVSESLERMGKHVPRRLSLGANVVGRMAVEGARMAMDSGLDFFSPAKGAKHKYM